MGAGAVLGLRVQSQDTDPKQVRSFVPPLARTVHSPLWHRVPCRGGPASCGRGCLWLRTAAALLPLADWLRQGRCWQCVVDSYLPAWQGWPMCARHVSQSPPGVEPCPGESRRLSWCGVRRVRGALCPMCWDTQAPELVWHAQGARGVSAPRVRLGSSRAGGVYGGSYSC